jgi:C4-dicarboxylate-specific signal transduction histidine kinase
VPPAARILCAALILADIRADDRRAADIIRRLRSLLKKHEVAREPLRLHRVIEDALRLVSAEAASRKVALRFEPAAA